MKTFALTVSAATLLAGSAFAQDSRPSPRDQIPTAPSFQQGSGQRAGGPAAELNSPTGMRPATTGTVVVPAPGGTATYPSATQPARDPMQGNVPAVQQGSGQTSGGPARELIPNR